MKKNTNYYKAVIQMFEKMIENYKDKTFIYPVKAYITGGVAVYFYTQHRQSDDVDVVLNRKLDLPNDLSIEWIDDDGKPQLLVYDENYNDSFGIVPEDYEDNAMHVTTIEKKIEIYVLHPKDLIISKLDRFADIDREDIQEIIKKVKIDKIDLVDTVKYEISGRALSKWKIKEYGYNLDDVVGWIDQENNS